MGPEATRPPRCSTQYKGSTADSRAVQPGYLFAALPGIATDGARFIAEASHARGRAILTPEGAWRCAARPSRGRGRRPRRAWR